MNNSPLFVNRWIRCIELRIAMTIWKDVGPLVMLVSVKDSPAHEIGG